MRLGLFTKSVNTFFMTAIFTLIITVNAVNAEYRDLIDMPAVTVDSARYGLILDVVQTGERLVSVGERGHILWSEDNGETWVQADVDSRAHLNAVYFPDAKNGWAVGEDAVILHSSDGGKSWSKQFDARGSNLKGPLLDVWFKNDREGFAVGVYNKIYRTRDGGENWEDWYDHVDNIDEWHLFAIATVDDEKIYLASEQGLLFVSIDGGESFSPLQTDHYGSFHGILAKRGDDGQDVLLLSGVGGVLYTSADSGKSWSAIATGTEAGLSGSTWLSDESAVIVGYGGTVLYLDSEMRNVSPHPQENGLPLNSVTALADNRLIVVGFGGSQTITVPQKFN